MRIFRRTNFLALVLVLSSNHVIAQGLQSVKSMDSIFVTGYLIGDGKSVVFFSTKDPTFNVAILRKKKNNGCFIQYKDPNDIKILMGLDKYRNLNLIDNPLKDIFNKLFGIKFKNREYTIVYLNQYMLKVKATGFKGEKLEFITFPFYRL